MNDTVKYALVAISLATVAGGLAWYFLRRIRIKPCSSYTNKIDCEANHCYWWNEACQSELPWLYPCIEFDGFGFCREGDGLKLNSVNMIGENEYNISHPYDFFMTNVQGKTLLFHYSNPTGLFTDPWHETPYQMVCTYDGINWGRISGCEYDDVNDVYSFWLTPEYDTIQISNYYPKNYMSLQYMMYSKRYSPFVRVSTIGKTYLGLDMDMMEITNFNVPESRKVHAVCICRQHPYESYPSFTMQGCIDSILSYSRYRNLIHWYFIPAVNADGVYHAIKRVNSQGVDVNRAWDKYPGEAGYAVEADVARAKINEIHNRYGIDFYFDMHAQPWGGGGGSYIVNTEVTPWCPIYRALTNGRYGCSGPNSGVPGMSRIYVHNELGVPYSFTNEVSQKDWHITVPSLYQDGWALAESVYQLFYQPPLISISDLEAIHCLDVEED